MLKHLERPARGEPEGLLVLLHGRGADEHDLFPLLDVLDPERRLLGVTPRAPLALPPGGAHWYAFYRVGEPDPATFDATYPRLVEWLESLGFPPERTVLGGFSQGTAMTYALGLGQGRPRPAGLIALSGFMPSVPRLRARPVATAAAGRHRARDVRRGDRRRMGPRRARPADGGGRGRPLSRVADGPHDRPGLPRRALEVAAAVMEFQLREYTIADGRLDDFIAEWREHVLPLRLSLGFSVLGPWVDREVEQLRLAPRVRRRRSRRGRGVLRVAGAQGAGSRSGKAHRRLPPGLARAGLA